MITISLESHTSSIKAKKSFNILARLIALYIFKQLVIFMFTFECPGRYFVNLLQCVKHIEIKRKISREILITLSCKV